MGGDNGKENRPASSRSGEERRGTRRQRGVQVVQPTYGNLRWRRNRHQGSQCARTGKPLNPISRPDKCKARFGKVRVTIQPLFVRMRQMDDVILVVAPPGRMRMVMRRAR